MAKHYSEPQYGQVTVTLTNGGMDKTAHSYHKQGRKVLELVSRHSTSYVGHYRIHEEAVLWNGPACRAGVTCWSLEVLTNRHTGKVATRQEGDVNYAVGYNWEALRAASPFTTEEQVAARLLLEH